MSENLSNSKARENRNGSDSTSTAVPILSNETEPLFRERLREVIGDRKLIAFAKGCGFSDSLLGSYLRGEKLPGFEKLIAIAETGGVSIDWLATGRLPKTRAELKAAARPQDAGRLDTYRIAVEAVQAWQLENQRFLTPEKLREVLDLLVDLAEDKPEQIKPLTAKVLRLAA